MSTATLGQAAHSVLGIVTTSANAVSAIFTAAGGGASMLNKYVEDAQAKQRKNSAINMSEYDTFLMEEKAIENAERSLIIVEKLSSNPRLTELYTQHKARIEKVLADLS